MEFKRFMAIWFLAVILGTVLATGTLKILYIQPEQIERNETQTQGNNHFSVRWMGFLPTYSNQYPDYCVCINNLAGESWTMDLGFQIKNQEDQGYYFQIAQNATPPTGWTLPTRNLTFVGIDVSYQFTYNATRSKIASISQGELIEQLPLVVRAYRDIGLTDFYSQDSFNITFRFLDYTSPNWSVLYNDNFDDKTQQSWTNFGSPYQSVSVADTYYRSFPYSLRATYTYSGGWGEAGFRKSFTVPAGFPEAYLIFSLRSDNYYPNQPSAGVRVYYDGTQYFGVNQLAVPSTGVWYQFALKIPVAKTTQIDVYAVYAWHSEYSAYLDDVFVIAK